MEVDFSEHVVGDRVGDVGVPKDSRYLVPSKDVVRRAEQIGTGDVISVSMVLNERPACASTVGDSGSAHL